MTESMKSYEEITRLTTNSVNTLPSREMFSVFGRIAKRRFADIYLWSVLKKIFEGLHNVAFFSSSPIRDESSAAKIERLLRFVTDNADTLVYMMYSLGYACIVLDARGKLTIQDAKTLKTDADGAVYYEKDGKKIYPECVYYSQTYRFIRRSDFDVIKNNIDALDKYASADEYLTETLGAFGILCGKNMPISEKDKENFMQRLMRRVGIGRDKMQIVPFNTEVDFKQVNLPIKDLALSDKLKEQMQLVAGYFGVPYDLLPVAGSSTYANQRQAVINFYSSCISPLAESLLSLARMAVRMSNVLVPSDYITFRIDNVPEINEETIPVDYKMKLVELYKLLTDAGLPTEDVEKEINTYAR